MKGISNLNNIKLNRKQFCTNPFIWINAISWKHIEGGNQTPNGKKSSILHLAEIKDLYDSGPLHLLFHCNSNVFLEK